MYLFRSARCRTWNSSCGIHKRFEISQDLNCLLKIKQTLGIGPAIIICEYRYSHIVSCFPFGSSNLNQIAALLYQSVVPLQPLGGLLGLIRYIDFKAKPIPLQL